MNARQRVLSIISTIKARLTRYVTHLRCGMRLSRVLPQESSNGIREAKRSASQHLEAIFKFTFFIPRQLIHRSPDELKLARNFQVQFLTLFKDCAKLLKWSCPPF